MAKDPLVSFQQTWSRRSSTAQSRGYSPAAITPIYQMDLQRIQRGAQPYTEAQAGDAIAAAAGVQPIQHTGGSKPDWNPLHLIGRGIGDIGSTLKMLPRIPHAIYSDLSHISQMPGAIAKGAGEIGQGDVGHGLQDISRAPGLQSALLIGDFIPGVDLAAAPLTAAVLGAGVAGQVMTPEGRKEISRHPGIAAMNLLPAAGEAGMLGKVSKVADLSPAETARTGLTAEELAQKSAIRVPGKIRVQLENLPVIQRAQDRMAGLGFGKRMRMHLFGPTSDANALLLRHMDQFAEQNGVHAWTQLPEADRQRLTFEVGVQRKSGDVLPAAVRPLADEIRAQTDRLLDDRDIAAVPLPEAMGGGVEYYHPGSRVERAQRALEKRKDVLARATDTARTRVEELRAAEQEHQSTLVNGERPNIGTLVDQSSAQLAQMKPVDFSRAMTPAQRADFVRRGAEPPQGTVIADARSLASAKAASERLLGSDGPVQRSIEALGRGKHSLALSRLVSPQVTGMLERIAKVDPQAAEQLRAQIEGITTNLDSHLGPTGLLERNRKATEVLDRAKTTAERADSRAKTASASVSKGYELFHNILGRNPSARFMPRITEDFWGRMTQIAQDMYSGDPQRLERAMASIRQRDMDATFGDLLPAKPEPFPDTPTTGSEVVSKGRTPTAEATVGPPLTSDVRLQRQRARAQAGEAKAAFENKVFPDAEKVLRDVAKTWADLRKDGLDPVFLHKMSELAKGKLPKVNPGALLTPTITKARALDVSGGYLDVGFGLLRSEAELVARRMGEEIVQNHVIPYLSRDRSEAVQQLLQRHEAAGAPVTRAQVEAELNRDNVAFNSSPFGASKIKGTTDRIIPRDIQAQIDQLGYQESPLGILKSSVRKGQGVYVFAVTGLSPLHVAHVAFSNIFAHLTTDPIGALQSIKTASALTRGEDVAGIGTLPISFHQPSQFPSELMDLYGAGQKTGVRLMLESRLPQGLSAADKALALPRKLQELQVRVDTWMSQMGRAMEYVVQRRKGFDPEEALYETGRVFSLYRDMNNIERNILRTWMPFVGWTKYLVRFALQYPIDHPVRAGIVSNFAQTEQQDWGSGLPQDLAQMFFLGHPDPSGKQTAFDIRQINPFRDVGRDFTWAGFAGALNPVVDAALQSMGVNTYTGSAELYPELQVDPNTGSLTAKRSNFFGNLANAALPQAKGIEGLLGWSDQMRVLKKTDPSAFSAALARSFHFPWLPRQISIPQARAKMQLNNRRVAETAASKALETGNFSTVSQYNVVPYKGQLLTPQQLGALYAMAKRTKPNENPASVLRKLKVKKR